MDILYNIIIIFILLFQVIMVFISALIVLELYRSVFRGDVPFVRSAKKSWLAVLSELKEDPGKVFYELGCGDASLLFMVENSKKMKVKGYEIGYLPYFIAKLKAYFKKSNVEVLRKDFFTQDISNADYVYIYLLPSLNKKFENQVLPKLKPGTIIISNTFKVKSLEPYKTIDIYPEKTLDRRLYFYKIQS